MKRIWNALPCNKRRRLYMGGNSSISQQENEGYSDLQEGVVLGRMEQGQGSAGQGQDVHAQPNQNITPSSVSCNFTQQTPSPVFMALQRGDMEEMLQLLTDDGGSVMNMTCGGDGGGGGGGLTLFHAAVHLHHLPALTLILNHGAEVNSVDDNGNTALHIAVSDGWNAGVAELLHHGASPDTYSDTQTRDTPLQSALHLGNTEAALKMLEYHPDLTVVNSEGCSLLHLAARTRCPNTVRRLVREKLCMELQDSLTSLGNSVLHAVLAKDHKVKNEDAVLEIIQILFEAGVDVNVKNESKETPIYLAAYLRLPKCVELLLSLGADPLSLTTEGQSTLHAACKSGCAGSLKHLLDTGGVAQHIFVNDDKNFEPFHYAVSSSSIDCCELLLTNGDHLTREDSKGMSRVELLLEYLPTASHLLSKLFDGQLTLSPEPQHHQKFNVSFDYSGILPPGGEQIQSSLIKDLNNSQAENLLKHPLLESFLCIKWSKIKLFFYFNLVSFSLFIVLHTVYIISMYQKGSLIKKMFTFGVLRILHTLMYLIILCPEIITIIANPKKYLRHWETFTKVISLTASAIVIFAHSLLTAKVSETGHENVDATAGTNETVAHQSSPLTRQIAATSVFFGWVELMMLCGRLPILGSHVLMFTRIAKSAIKFIAAFSGLLIGFATSFLVLFHEIEEFATFWTSLVKTLMMMIGEVDYTDLVGPGTAYISYLFLVLFLFLVCILMANLLIGLAVDDISSLERLGKIERLSKQASYIITFEKIIKVVWKYRLLPRLLIKKLIKYSSISPKKSFFVNKIITRRRRWTKPSLPPDSLQQAIEIGRANEMQTDSMTHNNTQNDITKMICQKLESIENTLGMRINELTAQLKQQKQNTERKYS